MPEMAISHRVDAALEHGLEGCGLSREDALILMEECSLALDSFHFGGSNTVSDALYLRLPILCREGDRWYNRIGPCMLRQAGLSDLIAHTEEDALRLAHRLIHDEPWRITLTHQLHQANLAETIYSRQHAISFAQTISSLLAEPAATEPSPRRDDLTN